MLLSGLFGSSNSTPPASNNNNANNNFSPNTDAETEETSAASGGTQTGSATQTSNANSAQAVSETSSETETSNGGSAQAPSGNGKPVAATTKSASGNAQAKAAEAAKPDALELARQAAQRVVDEARTQSLLSNIAPVAASAGESSKSYAVSLLSPSGVAEAQIKSPTPANAEPKSAKAK